MNKMNKTVAALLLGAGMSLFAAEANVAGETSSASAVNTQEQSATAQKEGGAEATANGNNGSAHAEMMSQAEIDAQIDRIKNADPAERRELMNQFKKELTHMSQEQRTEALSKLQGEMQGKDGQMRVEHAGEHAGSGMANADGKHTNMREMAQTHQAAQMEYMGNAERMGQKRGMDQYMHNHPDMAAGGAGHGQAGGGASAHNPNTPAMPFGRH